MSTPPPPPPPPPPSQTVPATAGTSVPGPTPVADLEPRPTPSGPHDPIPLKTFTPAPEPPPEKVKKKWWASLYDRETRQYCGRTCISWLQIITYSIFYVIFLSVFTMVFLFSSLMIMRATRNFIDSPPESLQDNFKILSYADYGIGLSATPTALNSHPLIWYTQGDETQYQPYVEALDKLLNTSDRKRRDVSVKSELGPCGSTPYGYGDEPCVILRINKRLGWSAKPLSPNSPKAKTAPVQVQKWLTLKSQKLWLHCSGHYPWEKEHIGTIKYYPDPPGFEPSGFPQNMSSTSQLVAIQVSGITVGVSLAIECSLYYDRGPSSMNFVIYIAPDKPVYKKLLHQWTSASKNRDLDIQRSDE